MKFTLPAMSSWLLLLISVFVTVVAYLPGLYGDFEFDDSINILENAAIRNVALTYDSVVAVAVSGNAGPIGRSISMLSFAGNYYFTGYEPFFFKLTNLLIHIVAGLGVYVFIRELTLALDKDAETSRRYIRADVVALITASIWLIHPLNVTSVLYIVQRMTSLAALFTFWALALYVYGRSEILNGKTAKGILLVLVGIVPLTGLAAMSKENGVLAPYLMLCIEIVVFRFACPNKGARLLLCAFFAALVLVPVLVVSANFDRVASFMANTYSRRDFSLQERLLTQPHVLMFYLRLLLMPNASSMGIYHDDFPISGSSNLSLATFFSVGAVTALIVAGLIAVRRAPALAIGTLWFFIGHSMESTFLALEMVHEHRNYLPIVGPIFAAAYYFWHVDFNGLAVRAKGSIVIVLFLLFGTVTYLRSVEWSSVIDHAAIEVHNHPNSERANYQMGRMHYKLYEKSKKAEMATLASQYFERASNLGPTSIFAIIAMLQMAYKADIDPAPDLVERATKRLQYGRAWEPNMLALDMLVKCQVTDYCRLKDADMTALLKAALANPGASAGTKGAANTLLAGYYVNKMQRVDLAAPHIDAAVQSEPGRVDFRLELIRLYILVENLDEANAELEVARKHDKWGLFKTELDVESARLDTARKARKK